MTNQLRSLLVNGQYISVLQSMINEWRTATFIIQEHHDFMGNFLALNGPRLEIPMSIEKDEQDDNDHPAHDADDTDCESEPAKKPKKAE
jgi:hypothetical protein